MDRIGLTLDGNADDVFDVQICLDRAFAFADLISLVRLEAMQAQLVLFGVDCDGCFARLTRIAISPRLAIRILLNVGIGFSAAVFPSGGITGA